MQQGNNKDRSICRDQTKQKIHNLSFLISVCKDPRLFLSSLSPSFSLLYKVDYHEIYEPCISFFLL